MGSHREFDLPAAFYEDDIIALQEIDANELYVPLQRLCATLGLELEDTAALIRSHPLLSSGLRPASGDSASLRVDLLPLWLSTIDPRAVDDAARDRLILYQRECASVLWQAFRPQGFGPEDALLPDRAEMTPAEQAYQGMMAQASLARQQMMIERELDSQRVDGNRAAFDERADHSGVAYELARLVRRIAHGLAARTRRNEYAGIYSGLQRQFGISSYRNMPRGRLSEATEWLERWHGDILGEPEPPPDI
jgi:hypothetical protein